MILPNSHGKTNEKLLELIMGYDLTGKKVLDLGCGSGYFTKLLWDNLSSDGINPDGVLFASDICPDEYQFDKGHCQYGDFNAGLSYEDNFFDTVCSIEVIEHIENQFQLIREIYRILKPGGTALITTPNILNINSRIKFLGCGLYPLFDLLPADNDSASCHGHIHPISLIYLSYILRKTGFSNIEFYCDRLKKSAVFFTILFYPIVELIKKYHFSRMERKHSSIYKENEFVVKNINTFNLLTSRTIILKAVK